MKKRRLLPALSALIILALLVGSLWFLKSKSKPKEKTFATGTPAMRDIIKKSIATGQLVPREQISIKPRVSGVLSEINVEPGDIVAKDQVLGVIEIVPNVVNLNEAQSRVRSARIAADNAQRELNRHKKLFDEQVISESEVSRYKVDYDLKRQTLAAARSNLTLVKKGALGKKNSNTQVRATVAGMVLATPFKKGSTVIESNAFNPGTDIAVIADMKDIIFEGKVDESEVGKLKNGMKLNINVGAIEDKVLVGTLEHIAPQGTPDQGAMQFTVRAKVEIPDGVLIRAGYSSTADIVLDSRTGVLTVDEKFVGFDEDKKPYVEVEVGDKKFEKRDVKLGLSDGIYVEVLSGVQEKDVLKVQTGIQS